MCDIKDVIENAPESIKEKFIYRKHKKGSSIIFPEEEIKYLYILISGKAEVYSQNHAGSVISLYTFESYSCFGDIELFNSAFKTLGIMAEMPCETISVPRSAVFQWMEIDFDFNLYLIKQLSEKLISSSNTVAKMSLLTIKDRTLDSIYVHYKLGDLHEMTKQKLSCEICAPIRSLNRSIAQCCSEGFIYMENKKIKIKSMEKLEKYYNDFLV